MNIGEFELIDKLKEKFRPEKRHVLGIGDDCAVVNGDQLVTTDALVESVHFKRDWISPVDLGYKAMAVNISDLAAMGGYAESILITLGISEEVKDSEVDGWIQGIAEAQEEFHFEVIGGDTVKSPVVFFSITAMGRPFVKPLLRSDAKKGDLLYVSGTLGDSKVGLDILDGHVSAVQSEYFVHRHVRPVARVRFMEYLSRHVTVHACMDISDGLLGDVSHITDESGVGVFIDAFEIPISLEAYGHKDQSAVDYLLGAALNGGEDYEILFSSPNVLDVVKIEKKTGVRVTPIGRMLDEGHFVGFGKEKKSFAEVMQSYRHF